MTTNRHNPPFTMQLRNIFPSSRHITWTQHSFNTDEYSEDRCTSPPFHTSRGVFCNGHADKIDPERSIYFTSNHLPEVQRIIRTTLARAGIVTTAYEDASWLHSPNSSEYTRRSALAKNADHIIIAYHPLREQDAIAFELGYISLTDAQTYTLDLRGVGNMIAAAALESQTFTLGDIRDDVPHLPTAWTQPVHFGFSADPQHLHLVGLDITGNPCFQLQLPHDSIHDELTAYIVARLTSDHRARYVPNHFKATPFVEHLIRISPYQNIQHIDPADLKAYQDHPDVHVAQALHNGDPTQNEALVNALVLAISAFQDLPVQHARDNRTIINDEQLLTFDNDLDNQSSQLVARGIFIMHNLADVVTLDARHRIISLTHHHVSEVVNSPNHTSPYTMYTVYDDSEHYLQPDATTIDFTISLPGIQDLTHIRQEDLTKSRLTIIRPLSQQIANNGIHLAAQPQVFALALANAAWHNSANQPDCHPSRTYT